MLDLFFIPKDREWNALITDVNSDSYRSRGVGKNHLIAACRCIVASVYGDNVKDKQEIESD